MPPKQKATEESGSATKVGKVAKADKVDKPPRNKRWAKISGSANAYDAYNFQIQAPDAYDYICLCKPLNDSGYDEDDEWDDEDEDEEDEDKYEDKEENVADKQKKVPCDNGETCVCFKPAAELPEHSWVVTNASIHKLTALGIMTSLRRPDGFGMYISNDHYGFGVLEVGQNLVLDFEEAKTWKEKWTICEATALFFAKGVADPLFQVDDVQGVEDFMELIGVMFTTMLAILDREGLLKPESEVKSLGVVMGAFVRFILTDIGPDHSMDAGELDKKVLAYAKKYNIELKGLSDLEDELEDQRSVAEALELPASDDKNSDPWGWKKTLSQYKKDYGRPKIGGDTYDITTFTPAARRKEAFGNKDPLSKKDIDALKAGMVMQYA
ncbi:hypothetical protein N7520_006866 [Penicillium odoratum]|uniref:uncharacterized protein n=1 Tax=Penicillium odoratum TaxID=1167516 RepID=UPI002547AFDF|nr:uncharacterized protein N7520_006866 [Penicillium odoratum]KAJ5759710.1 hypothetical protein N7520_006866 [Penicillium odoratum]